MDSILPAQPPSEAADTPDMVRFFLNGQQVIVPAPSPDLLLIDFLRSPAVGLIGPKKPCGQGGCGGCTVILSQWNGEAEKVEHAAINSCLRPVVALDGLAVTTIEGTGSVRRPNPAHLAHSPTFGRAGVPLDQYIPAPVVSDAQEESAEKRDAVLESVAEAAKEGHCGPGCGHAGHHHDMNVLLREEVPEPPSEMSHMGMNPVAWRLAMNNGTQCGYCTVGFVMNMSEFITNNPKATKREIEGALDGNLCRCTGYRAILTGMKTFASDWTKEDEEHRMKCKADPETLAQRPTGPLVIPFPPEARLPPEGVNVAADGRIWLSPPDLDALAAAWQKHSADKPRLVAGNTSYGVYKEEYQAAKVLLNLHLIKELRETAVVGEVDLTVPAGMDYTALIDLLGAVMEKRGEVPPVPPDQPLPTALSPLGALRFMAERTAGRIVRNAASLGGNTMMMLAHIAAGTGSPFPSDLATALVAADVSVDLVDLAVSPVAVRTAKLADLVDACVSDADLPGRLLLLRYRIPYGTKNDLLLPQKVALREVNSHTIVNGTSRFLMGADRVVTEAVLVYGGIAPYPWRAANTEAAMQGQVLQLTDAPRYVAILEEEVRAELARWEPRMAGLPDEGFTNEYRIQLALSFLYKSIINTLNTLDAPVPESLRSTGDITWGRWPVSFGTQSYVIQEWKRPVSQPYIKYMAMEQANGQVHYTHEIPLPPRSVNASFIQSGRALASWYFSLPGSTEKITPEQLRDHLDVIFPDFIDLITADNIPKGGINLQGMGMDQPVFATGDQVDYVGQSLALACAGDAEQAAAIAQYVEDNCVTYGPVTVPKDAPDWWSRPILSLEEAIRVGSIYPDWPQTAPYVSHIWKITRPGSNLSWAELARDPLNREAFTQSVSLNGTSCMLVGHAQQAGGQIHFYMEPQAAVAEPADGRRLTMRPSTQSPMEMHQSTAMAIGAQYNAVEVVVPPVGGGFGGKTEQARFVTAAAAVAAYAIKRPVRLTLTREQDTGMIGKRHAYYGQYQVAIDTGAQNPDTKGMIRGLLNRMWGDGGAFYDCSFIVSNCIQTRADAAYMVPNFESQIDVCRTNTAPSTAFRAFGDIQGKIIVESAIDDAAFAIGMRAEDVREKNLYAQGDVTPFGQALSYCYIRDVWKYLKDTAKFEERYAAVQEFNRANRWRKRGIAMMPVKYGSGYNLAMLEQAAALISIYQGDGTIMIHQSGVEMGQGLLTQMRQIAAYILDVPLDMILVQAARTDVMPNPTSTGGSTGTAYNGEAVKRLCQQMRARLQTFADDMRDENGPDWCKQQGINYWDFPEEGWKAVVTTATGTGRIWQKLVALAYQYRVGLTATFTAPIAGGDTPVPALTYKPVDDQPVIPNYHTTGAGGGAFDNFVGFTYSGACTVVEVDILTGETKILSSDLVYDMGWSLNPAIDIGQVEGAFVQGIGYVTSEMLVFERDGDEKGRLNTLNTWTYKPPAITSIPLELNTHLFPRNLTNVPVSPTDGVLSSKEVGEPPLVLATTVFLAIKSAIRASRLERGLPGLFRLDAPATVQEVRRAAEVRATDLSA
ncbi:molybdopterin cofactor-binding domain-containing protein [Niveispirillum irakense]|uniref:molybdopterin cofactor-binding domain-containing protein n=1 Tax=Niveispirillum irakense TaxID=34011 RepID=UPI0003FB17A8|nr:molybdopterin cofactor-binding domain-containing protein [Niveispirillum irakense]